MIYIVHGEDTPKSRNLIVNHQKKLGAASKITLDIKNTNPKSVYEQCVSSSLFGETPFVVFDITESGKTDLKEYVEAIKKIPENATLVVFSAKALTKSNAFINDAQKLGAKIIENSLFTDANIFKFADTLFTKNRNLTYKELNKLLQEEYDPFYIFSMILYQLRNVAKVFWHTPSVSKLKPFQLEKINSMSFGYTEEKLGGLFSDLYKLEKAAKIGGMTPETFVTIAIEKVLNS